jgi:hypothetical protein
MQTMTTQEQIAAIRQMCEDLPSALIRSAWVNDWGRFGNFDVFLTPHTHTRSTTNQLKAAIKKALPGGAVLREIFSPDPIREYDHYRQRTRLVGYECDYWSVDIDFEHYDPHSNRFDSQLAGVKVDGYPVGQPQGF